MKPRDVIAYVLLSIIWGFSFLALLKAVEAFGWIGAVTLRALMAGAILLVVGAATRRRFDFSAGWRPFAVVGATTVAAQLVGMSFATPRIGTAMAAILVATIPLFSMVISQLWGIEHVTTVGRVGLVLGFGGIVLLVGFPTVPISGTFVLGCAGSLIGSLSAAFGSNYVRRRLRDVGSWEVTAGSFLFGGLLTLPLLFVVPIPTAPRPVDFGYLVLLGGVCSALAYVLYFRLVADLGATKAISVEFVVTVVAVLVGSFVLGERLSVVQVAGAVIIVTGCALVLGLVPARRSAQTNTPRA